MHAIRCNFKVHSFDTDAFGQVTPSRMLGYLLESAGVSADALGFGVRLLQAQGLTWVLGRIKIQLDEPMTVGDRIEVETWPSGLQRAVAMREFRLLRAGKTIGLSTSQWFVLDMATRMPLRPQKLFPVDLQQQTEHLVAIERIFPAMPQPATIRREYEVRRADIDLNHHVTAASYVAWAMECISEDIWSCQRLSELDVQFLEECHWGSRVASEAHAVDPAMLLHRVVRQADGKELARLRSNWVPR